ncbi:hypothetical protein NMG60_11006933 [Bertholletia excelsa]
MLRFIFLFSDFGEVMLEKQLTGHRVDRSICTGFWDQSISQGDSFKLAPMIASPTNYLFQIVHEGITFLACNQVEMPPLMGIEVIADVLPDCLFWGGGGGGLNEDLIKDNFVIVYELLDEMIDNGLPLMTEPNTMREVINPPNIVSKVWIVVTGNSFNVSNTHLGATASCSIVDLVKEMDAILNRDGALMKCAICGEVQVNSHLSGLPDLTILSFLPPDGQFKLMSYRVKKLKNTPIYVKAQLTSDSGTCCVCVLVGIQNDPGKTSDSISLQFKLPPCVLSADLTTNHGTVNVLANKTRFWSIGRIPEDKAPSMLGSLVFETGLECLNVFSYISGGIYLIALQIDKLDLKNLRNRPYKGSQVLTRAGEYEIRL